VAGNLDDMGRLLGWLGVGRRARRFLAHAAAGRRRGLRLLDVASGSGWLIRVLSSDAAAAGSGAGAVALDSGTTALERARLGRFGEGGVAACRADARRLPFRSGSFDVAVCTGFLHHLEAPELAPFLGELDRVCRVGWWAEDLLRSRSLWLCALIGAALASRNPLTRHDGPLSVRRAYSLGELRRAAEASGVEGVRVERSGVAVGAVWRLAAAP
jgi:ubiquinone/menaquinone biosynthesis C-methylase UbiE